jgi:hypothetical protein
VDMGITGEDIIAETGDPVITLMQLGLGTCHTPFTPSNRPPPTSHLSPATCVPSTTCMYHSHGKIAAATPIAFTVSVGPKSGTTPHNHPCVANTAQSPMLPTPHDHPCVANTAHNHPCCRHRTITHVADAPWAPRALPTPALFVFIFLRLYVLLLLF